MLNVETLRHLGTTDAKELPNSVTSQNLGINAIYLSNSWTTAKTFNVERFNHIYTNKFMKVAKEIPKL